MPDRTMLKLACALVVCVAACAQAAPAHVPEPLRRSRQLVVGTTRDWDGVGGTLRRFERRGAASRWTQVGGDVPIVVGRTGLAGGGGAVPLSAGAGPRKKEGDGKATGGA